MQSSLKKRWCGIFLMSGGLFIIIVLLVLLSTIIVNQTRLWTDLLITVSLWFIFFCVLIFILPAIYLIYTSKSSPIITYNGAILAWFIVISILTFIFIVVITLAGGIIAGASEEIPFIIYFHQNFGYFLGLGFLFSFLVICLGVIISKLNN